MDFLVCEKANKFKQQYNGRASATKESWVHNNGIRIDFGFVFGEKLIPLVRMMLEIYSTWNDSGEWMNEQPPTNGI